MWNVPQHAPKYQRVAARQDRLPGYIAPKRQEPFDRGLDAVLPSYMSSTQTLTQTREAKQYLYSRAFVAFRLPTRRYHESARCFLAVH